MGARVLYAYFDDSGTHASSEIVLVGGIFGSPNQMDLLSERWAKKLADPSPGKPPLKRFHMTDCEAADGEFLGWSRTATDYLVHELGDIILKSGVWGFAAAIERRPYEELVIGDLRRACGDAETFCYIECFNQVRKWAYEFTGDRKIAMIFDSRPPDKQIDVRKINEVYGQTKEFRSLPDFVSLDFLSSTKIVPLQAADMIAWEFYQDALDTLRGRKLEDGYRRKQIERLVKGGRLRSEILDRNAIEKMAPRDFDKDMLATLAEAVDFK
jgi:hypothetical protein